MCTFSTMCTMHKYHYCYYIVRHDGCARAGLGVTRNHGGAGAGKLARLNNTQQRISQLHTTLQHQHRLAYYPARIVCYSLSICYPWLLHIMILLYLLCSETRKTVLLIFPARHGWASPSTTALHSAHHTARCGPVPGKGAAPGTTRHQAVIFTRS